MCVCVCVCVYIQACVSVCRRVCVCLIACFHRNSEPDNSWFYRSIFYTRGILIPMSMTSVINPTSINASIIFINPTSVVQRETIFVNQRLLSQSIISSIRLLDKIIYAHRASFYLSKNYFHQFNLCSNQNLYFSSTELLFK